MDGSSLWIACEWYNPHEPWRRQLHSLAHTLPRSKCFSLANLTVNFSLYMATILGFIWSTWERRLSGSCCSAVPGLWTRTWASGEVEPTLRRFMWLARASPRLSWHTSRRTWMGNQRRRSRTFCSDTIGLSWWLTTDGVIQRSLGDGQVTWSFGRPIRNTHLRVSRHRLRLDKKTAQRKCSPAKHWRSSWEVSEFD